MLQVTSGQFSLAGPGQTASGQVWFTSPASASYTAAITTDPSSIFKVLEISATRMMLEYIPTGDPGDGVHGIGKPVKGLVAEPIGSTNGVTPLTVLTSDVVTVVIQMACPPDPDDTYSAALTITSSNSADTTIVPLSVPTGQIDVQVINSNATAAPGSDATWFLRAQSLAGAGANISFAPELTNSPVGGLEAIPSSVSVPPITLFVPRRGQQMVALPAAVGEVTPPGSYAFYVAETIFNGAESFTPFSLSLAVTDPLVFVTASQSAISGIVPGKPVQFTVNVQLAGAGTTFDLAVDPPSPGLTCTFLDAQGKPIPNWQVDLATQEQMQFPVQLTADDTVAGSATFLTFPWSAYDGTRQGKVIIGLTILPEAVAFVSGTLGPSTTTASATWTLNVQGFWNFTGQIHESGVLGQDYGFGMALNVKDANGNAIGVVHSGSVGPDLPGGNNDDSWSDQGFDQRIIDLWPAIVVATSSAGLNVETDPGHIIVGILEALGIAAAAVLLVYVVLNIGGTGWECPDSPQVHVTGNNRGLGAEAQWKCYPKE